MVKDAVNSTTELAGSAVAGAQGILGDILSTLGGLMVYIKPVLVALAILIIGGWIIKKVMGLLTTALEKAKVDTAVEKIGLTGQLKEMGINITASALIAGIVGLVAKFFLYMAAVDALGIEALSTLLQDILSFILKDGIVALILLFAGITIAKIVKEAIENSASALSLSASAAKTAAKAAKIAVLVFTGMAVLTQLHIAEELITTLFTGVITALTLAGGIAFGLGGQEKAKEIIANASK